MTILVICGNGATEFSRSPKPNASKHILCRKAEGLLGFTNVTENGAGNIELPVCFLYCSLQLSMFEASLISLLYRVGIGKLKQMKKLKNFITCNTKRSFLKHHSICVIFCLVNVKAKYLKGLGIPFSAVEKTCFW